MGKIISITDKNMIYIPDEIRKVNPGLSDQELNDYLDKVWEVLSRMRPGQLITIKEFAPKHPELFTECVKNYMREHEWQDGLSFTRGFIQVQKYDLAFIKGKAGSASGKIFINLRKKTLKVINEAAS